MPWLDHIVICTRGGPENCSFYRDFLGLPLVKSSDNWRLYKVPSCLGGRPMYLGFRVDPNAPPGRHGAGQVEEICFSIPRGSVENWHRRAAEHHLRFCLAERFGQVGIRVRDPDGLVVLLCEHQSYCDHSYKILGLCGATLWVRNQRLEAELMTKVFGCCEEGRDGGIFRLKLEDVYLDLQDAKDFPQGRPGSGVVEYIGLAGCENVRRNADHLLQSVPGGWRLPDGICLRSAHQMSSVDYAQTGG